jgi:molybdopterin converting factor small subunit
VTDVTVRYFAAARAAAGVAQEQADAADLGALRTQLGSRDEQLARILAISSFLVDGLPWHDPQAPLPPRCTIDVLPPFAGG